MIEMYFLTTGSSPQLPPATFRRFHLKKLSLDRKYSTSQTHISAAVNSCLHNGSAQ